MVPSKHDWLIRHLLIVEAIVVCETVIDESVYNTILVRNRRHNHILKPAVFEPNIIGQPRFRVSIPQPDGSSKRIWLGPNRVIWVHYNGPTRNNIGFVDEDAWNYNIWNLCELDTNDQNVRRVYKDSCWKYEDREDPLLPKAKLPF